MKTKATLGELDRVVRVVKLISYVNSVPDFDHRPEVINGVSDSSRDGDSDLSLDNDFF